MRENYWLTNGIFPSISRGICSTIFHENLHFIHATLRETLGFHGFPVWFSSKKKVDFLLEVWTSRRHWLWQVYTGAPVSDGGLAWCGKPHAINFHKPSLTEVVYCWGMDGYGIPLLGWYKLCKWWMGWSIVGFLTILMVEQGVWYVSLYKGDIRWRT